MNGSVSCIVDSLGCGGICCWTRNTVCSEIWPLRGVVSFKKVWYGGHDRRWCTGGKRWLIKQVGWFVVRSHAEERQNFDNWRQKTRSEHMVVHTRDNNGANVTGGRRKTWQIAKRGEQI